MSAGLSYTMPDNVENLAVGNYSGSTGGTATLTRNAGANTIIGWSNEETINGLGGDDKLFGKGGDDHLNGGDLILYGDTDGNPATDEFELHVHVTATSIYFEDITL